MAVEIDWKRVGRNLQYFQTGWSYVGMAIGLLNLWTFAKVWQGTTDYLGIPFLLVIAGLPLIVVCGARLFGKFFYQKKLAAGMMEVCNNQGNDEFLKMRDDVENIRSDITFIKNQLTRKENNEGFNSGNNR